MFTGFQKLLSILLAGLVAFIGIPTATLATTSLELGETVEINGQVWKTAPVEAKIGNNETIENDKQPPKLTKAQIKEIEKLASESLKNRKQIIDKYVEYGVITKDRGNKIKESMDKHFKRMKEHDFIPYFHKHKRIDRCDCKDKE